MKSFIEKLLSDREGNFSTMRIIFLIWMFYSMAMGITVWSETKDVNSTILIVSTLSGIGVGLKFGQNFQENSLQKDIKTK